MLASRLDRAVALSVAVAVIGFAIVLDPALAGGLALAIAVIVIPGAVVSRAVFHGATPGLAELALLALSLGIAVLALGGLILHLLPGGLTVQAWIAYLLVVTVTGLAFVGIHRRAENVQNARMPPQRDVAHVAATVRRRIGSKDVVLIGVALGVATLALGIARVAAVTEPTPPFTALWLVPDAGLPSNVEVGVRSAEHATTTYSVELRSGSTLLGRWDVPLGPGGTWRTSVPITSPPTFNTPLEARLMLPGTSAPYRSVVLRDQPPE